MSLTSIDLGLREMLRDPKRRQEFFNAITEDEIASQIRALRKERDLSQSELAKLAEMKQSAVSRIEQADYSSWSWQTLKRAAAALDARWRIILEPCENAIQELENMEKAASDLSGEAAKDFVKQQSRPHEQRIGSVRDALSSTSRQTGGALRRMAEASLNSGARGALAGASL